MFVEKINPGNQNTLFPFLTAGGSKSTLIHGFTLRDYTLWKDNHFNYTSEEKINWGKLNGAF